MAATGYTTGDPQKVDVTGDTMTGDLALTGATTDLTVGGATTLTYQGVTGDVMRLLATGISTGVTSGGGLTINADPTKINVAATSGWIVDYNTSAPITGTNPTITYVSIAAQTGLALTGPPTQVLTWWLVTSAGAIVQQGTPPTPTQRRTHMALGFTLLVGGVISEVRAIPAVLAQPAAQFADLTDALGAFNTSGNILSPNGANLTIDKTSGKVFSRSFGHIPTYGDPHSATLPAQTPIIFLPITAVGIAGAATSTLDVGRYDPNGAGTLVTVSGGTNVSTNFRVWAFAATNTRNQIAIQYGQSTYATLADAVAGRGAGTYVVSPNIAVAGVLLGWISATHGATNLSDPSQATFTRAAKFAAP